MNKKSKILCVFVVITVVVSLFGMVNVFAGSTYVEKTYTLDNDFNEGSFNNTSLSIPDQIQLDDTTTPFGFIWIAVSSKGTVVKIDTKTGKILGEYMSSPKSQPKNPSRTTVDKNGSVWVANRDGNSVTRICLPESDLWIDKNGNGVCDTSTGLGDIKSWSNAGDVDTNGGVSTAEDECIINYVRVSSYATRHVSVDKNNDVWVSGLGNRKFDLLDGVTGVIKRTEGGVGYGGYGGLIDPNGVIWSARNLLRWDTSKPLTGSNGVNWNGYEHDSYGLAIDKDGNVWNTALSGNQIRKFAPDGSLIGTYGHGYYNAQGCAADNNGDIWVAHYLGGSPTVGHIKNNGTFVGNVDVPSGPTGVAVDSNGKIWATCYYSKKAVRIDPTKGPIGADGVTPVGEVDYISPDLGGYLYNYSDMTGSTLIGAPNIGTWTVTYDGNEADLEWGEIGWNEDTYGDGAISVVVSSSNDNVTFSPEVGVTNGSKMNVPDGRYIKVKTTLKRSSDGKSPILYDLTVESANKPPIVDEAIPSKEILWPVNHKFVDVNILGVTDPDGDEVEIEITKITSDEPTTAKSAGGKVHSPDAEGIGTDTAKLRVERIGESNGRVYEISFVARDNNGNETEGSVKVCVPHNKTDEVDIEVIDDGQLYKADEIN